MILASLVNDTLATNTCPVQMPCLPVRFYNMRGSTGCRGSTQLLKDTIFSILASFSLHSSTLILHVRLLDVTSGSLFRIKPCYFTVPHTVSVTVLTLDNKGNCQPLSVRMFLMLFHHSFQEQHEHSLSLERLTAVISAIL